VERTNHLTISRRLIAITPVLLIFGIIAQAILLVGAVVLYVPCLVFPGILDGPYQWITKGMGRIMVRAMFEAFLSGNMDRDTWTKALEDIDSMLNVLGLRMTFRPWEVPSVVPLTKGF